MIGNSRLHWAHFNGKVLERAWTTDHQPSAEHLPPQLGQIPLLLASVVPQQTELWLGQQTHLLTLADLPLGNLYPSLGIDRGLALYGAGLQCGFPCLVIDGGTALTITAADGKGQLLGGAILPGLGLQFQTLGDRLAALPYLIVPQQLPPLWEKDTATAMTSGIIYNLLGDLGIYLQAWQKQFPQASILVTGGDGENLAQLLNHYYPQLPVQWHPELLFWGMQGCSPFC